MEAQKRSNVIIPNGHDPSSFPPGTVPLSLPLCHRNWYKGQLEYKMHSAQLKMLQLLREASKNPLIAEFVVMCCRRIGKSTFGVESSTIDCIQNPGVRVYYVAETIEKAKSLLDWHMKKISIDAPQKLIKEYASDNMYIVGESELVCSGYGSRSKSNQRGFPAYRIYIEESRDFSPHQYIDVIEGAMEPMLADSDNGLIVHLTTPPDDPKHPFVEKTVKKCIEGLNLFRLTIWDHPRYTHQHKLNLIARAGGLTSETCRRELLAEIVRSNKDVIIPTFDSKRHKQNIEIVSDDICWMVWMDNGGEIDTTVAQMVAFDVKRDTCHIIDERVFPPNTETRQKISEVKRMEMIYTRARTVRIVDCSTQVRVDMQKTYDFETVKPLKTSKEDRRQEVIDIFAEDRITVHERAETTLATLEYARMKGKDFERTPQYGHADAVAAIIDGWNSRFKATAMGGTRRAVEAWKSDEFEHRHSFVGITFEGEDKPSFAVALSNTGALIKCAPHRGDKDDRIKWVKDFLSDLSNPSVTINLVNTGASFRTELAFILPDRRELELKGKSFDDGFWDLKDAVANRAIDLSTHGEVFKEFHAFKLSDKIPSEIVEALILAAHARAKWAEIKSFLANGNLVKPDSIQYCHGIDAKSVSAGIWFDAENFTYSFAAKAFRNGRYYWAGAGSRIRSLAKTIDQILALPYTLTKISVPNELKAEVEMALIHRGIWLEVRLFANEMRPERANVIQSFDQGLEVVDIKGNFQRVVEQALTFPATELAGADLLYAGSFCNYAASMP